MPRRTSYFTNASGGYVWQNAKAEAYYTALYVANGNADIDSVALYGIDLNAFKGGIDDFFVAGAAEGWLNKIVALYLYIGGTEATHAINAVNPATFNLTFYGSPTHSGAGTQYNGTTQYAMTGIIPSAVFSTVNVFYGYNSKTNTPAPPTAIVAIGSQDSITARGVLYKAGAGNLRGDFWTTSQFVSTTENSTDKDFIATRSTSEIRTFINGVFNLNKTGLVGGTRPNSELSIAAYNVLGSISLFTPWLYTYHVVGDQNISDLEVGNFYNARLTLDTLLGR